MVNNFKEIKSGHIVFKCFQSFSVLASDNEFFFVDNDTKISKIAPDSWKKVPSTTFVLYFRVKFFVSDISLLL